MRYKAILLDFYGTLVAEDNAIIERIVERIASASPLACTRMDVLREWRFDDLCRQSFGEDFKAQRRIERESLTAVLRQFQANLDPVELSEELFKYWRSAPAWDDARWFLRQAIPDTCLVSNIDNADIHAAIASVGWSFPRIVTSEDCRAYKPRKEVFLQALALLDCQPNDALHVGDSYRIDVLGAQAAGIDTAWINRTGRRLPGNATPPTFVSADLRQLLSMLTCPKAGNQNNEGKQSQS